MFQEHMHKGRSWIALVIFFAVTGVLVYSRVILHGAFLYDDFEYVVDNPIITDLSSLFRMSDPRQVGYISFALNYALGGENPLGYHLLNVLVHIANALLVFGFAGSLLFVLNRFREPSQAFRHAAFLSALVFLVHPAQTQAVSYVTQRFTSLATLFYLAAVWAYLSARSRLELGGPSGKAYALYAVSFLSTLLAMKTKEISYTIPVILLLIEVLVLRGSRFRGRRFIYLIPFAATLVMIPLMLFGPEWGLISRSDGIAEVTRTAKLVDLTGLPPLPYLFTQFRAIVVYVRTLLMPVGLRVVYDFPISASFFDLKVIASFLFLLAIAAGAVVLWKRGASEKDDAGSSLANRAAAFGIFWFFITLSVESSIIPIKDVIFEHRIYLPSVGFILTCCVLLVYHAERLFPEEARRAAVAGVALVIAVPLALGTYMRNDVWTDEVKLWDDVVQKSPGKAIGYNNRGMAYAKRGDYELALRDFDATIALFPKSTRDRGRWENADMNLMNMSKTYLGRGDVYIALGENEKAREDYRKAKNLVSYPVNVEDKLALANGYAKRGAYKHAIEEYNAILQWDPEHIEALNDRANAYSYLGRYAESIRDLTRIIGLEPNYVLAYYNRGIALAWKGQKEKAVADLKHACSLGFKPACDSVGAVERGEK